MLRSIWQCWWGRLTGAQPILTTTFPPYRRPGSVLELGGRQYRVTHVAGIEVWGRPVWRRGPALVVASPLKWRPTPQPASSEGEVQQAA